MQRPKTTVGMVFDPQKWLAEKGDEKTRPSIDKVVFQRPLDPEGRVPFTVFYYADDRLYRVEGVAPEKVDIADAVAEALESHWWGTNHLEVIRMLENDDDGS